MQQGMHIRRPTIAIHSPILLVGDQKTPAKTEQETVPDSETRQRSVSCAPMMCKRVGPPAPEFKFAPLLFQELFFIADAHLRFPEILNDLPTGTRPIGWLNAYITGPRIAKPIMARRDTAGFIDATNEPSLGVTRRADWQPGTRMMRALYRIEARCPFGDDLDLVINNPLDRGFIDQLIVQWWYEDPTKDCGNINQKFVYNDGHFSTKDCQLGTSPRIRIPRAMSQTTFIVVCDPSAT